MNRKISIFLIAFFAFSCSNKRGENHQLNNQEATPQVLDNNKIDVGVSSYDKRKNNDIVQQLFEEAMSKDEKLKSIDSRIRKVNELKADSLEDYYTYIRTNNDYWNSVKQYASQVGDTSLREELSNMIYRLEKKYETKVSPLNNTITQIENSERKLRDREILMKILVTEPMISNYQRNEYPDIKTLEAVKLSIDTLINDVEPYTKIKK